MEIKTFYMTQDELRKLLWDDKNPNWYNSYAIPVVESEYNHFDFKGFKYFSPHCLNERTNVDKFEFIVAFDGDKLIGIITDGDIRRLLLKTQASLPELFTTNVEKIMIHNPKTIRPTLSLEEALVELEENRFWVLPVVDEDQKLLGTVHMHDLLRGMIRK